MARLKREKTTAGSRRDQRSKDSSTLAALEERASDPTKFLPETTAATQREVAFTGLPISKLTQSGLKAASFTFATPIQQLAIPHALARRDLVAAAQTGSGKTLAFVIPLLEILARENWSALDGVGALVLSPTRELAMQTFQVLRLVGQSHGFSAGLLIGGNASAGEKARVARLNIIVATPGRLLQHMDESPDLDTGSLRFLVLDEADRLLDLGFMSAIDAIIANLPPPRSPDNPDGRQTLLFSATQTKRVQDLVRLSLKDPIYVNSHSYSLLPMASSSTSAPTPASTLPSTSASTSADDTQKPLQKYHLPPVLQIYTPLSLPEKLPYLFSFLQSHRKSKIIVFVQSCKQVRFLYEVFCHLSPGLPLLHLHGRQSTPSRHKTYKSFSTKAHACLISTDVASRGLDFPGVEWVLHMDCPMTVEDYIHRTGRTGRYKSKGSSLLFLLHSEMPFIDMLAGVGVDEVRRVEVNPEKIVDQDSWKSLVSGVTVKFPEIKYLAQKSFITYLKSLHVAPPKAYRHVFTIEGLPFKDFAESLGLISAPKVKFVKKTMKKINEEKLLLADKSDSGSGAKAAGAVIVTRVDRLFAKKNQTVLSEHYRSLVTTASESESGSDNDNDNDNADVDIKDGNNGAFGVGVGGGSDSEEEMLTLKRRDHEIDVSEFDVEPKAPLTAPTKTRLARSKQQSLSSLPPAQKHHFDASGTAVPAYSLETYQEFMSGDVGILEKIEEFRGREEEVMKGVDVGDKAAVKLRRRELKWEEKRKRRERDGVVSQAGNSGNGRVAILGGHDGVYDNEESGIEDSEDLSQSQSDVDDDDDEDQGRWKRQRTMADHSQSSDDDENIVGGDDFNGMGLAMQEDLALKLLEMGS